MPDTPKTTPTARVVKAPEYTPDLDAYGLRLNEAGELEPIEPCPDRNPADILQDKRAIVHARLWEGRYENVRGGVRLKEHRISQTLSRQDLLVRQDQMRTRLREAGVQLQEDDWFSGSGGSNWFAWQSPLDQNYVPLIPGPATRQQYWADYWASSAKCFEASTHSGIAKRAHNAMVHNPIGRGVNWKISDEKAQAAWEEFWKVNKMGQRIKSIGRDLSIFGEQMLRYFPAMAGQRGHLIIRQLDPATIYEIVTDQEDVETVFFYHQQYQTRQQLYSPPRANVAPQGPTPTGVTVYVIRQIDAGEIDHYKVNTVSGEARGRSDIFPALGDLKRLRDLTTAKVVGADIGTRVLATVQANGSPADIDRVIGQIFPNRQPLPPGSIVGFNEEVELKPFEYSGGRQVREDFTYEELIDGIVAATGVNRSDLGLSPAGGSGTTQATAMTTKGSSNKAYEDRRDLIIEILDQMFDRVMAAAGINGEVERDWILGDLAREDRSARLDDLEQAQANGWISHHTAATNAAAELEISDFDYDEEEKLIIEEWQNVAEEDGDGPAQGGKIRRHMIRATSRQAPMLDPTKAMSQEDDPPGVLVGADGVPAAPAGVGGPAPAGPAPAAQKTTGGIPASKMPGTQRARESDPRRTVNDPVFAQHADQYTKASEQALKAALAEIVA